MIRTSVAMATYNGAEYVVEQLESIRTQSMPVDEVIIHDDRSTDDTVAIVEKYIREHGLERTWKVSQNPKNLGYAANFIGAVKETEGEYIFFCDQDDIWVPDRWRSWWDRWRSIRGSCCCVRNSSLLCLLRTPPVFRHGNRSSSAGIIPLSIYPMKRIICLSTVRDAACASAGNSGRRWKTDGIRTGPTMNLSGSWHYAEMDCTSTMG